MKIEVVPYNPEWPIQFESLKSELGLILRKLNPEIEHIGSTAVLGLAAKPIIDIAVGVSSLADLEKSIGPMITHHYMYFEAFNEAMPERRLFVGLKNRDQLVLFQRIYTNDDIIPHEALNHKRLCHVHIWKYGSQEWTRHIAFREYLKAYATVRKEYAALKLELSLSDWEHGMEYNDGKDEFIKEVQSKAVSWYEQINLGQ